MRRILALSCLLFLGAAVSLPPTPTLSARQVTTKKAVPLKVEGDLVTIVKSLPCTVTAAPGAALYFWNVPTGLKATAIDNVLTVTGGAKGTYVVSVTSVTVDFENKKVVKDTGEVTLNIGDVPIPGPGPGPDPDPTPATKGPLRVLIVIDEETSRDYPKEQISIINGKRFEDHLNAKTDIDPALKGRRRWFILEKDQNVAGMPKEWQDAMKRPRKELPWIVLFGDDASIYHEGPLPKTVDEAISLVSKYSPKTRKAVR